MQSGARDSKTDAPEGKVSAEVGQMQKNGAVLAGKGQPEGEWRGEDEGGYAMHENRRAQGDREGTWAECDLCGREIGWGESYYRVGGENVCRSCLADFAAQILRVYEVRGGEDV